MSVNEAPMWMEVTVYGVGARFDGTRSVSMEQSLCAPLCLFPISEDTATVVEQSAAAESEFPALQELCQLGLKSV